MNPDTEDHAETVKEALSRNIVVDSVSRVAYLISRFFVPPFILAHITLTAYGLWSTAFILVSYIGVSTLGISNVYIKYVAEYAARKKYREANELISTGLFLTLPISFVLLCGVWLGWPLISRWLNIAPELQGDAFEVVLSVVAIFLASISLSVFHDVLVGVQKTALVQYVWTAGWVVETILIFWFVGTGRGIRGLAEAYVIRTCIEIGCSIPLSFQMVPWLRISPNLFSRRSLRELFSFGGIVQIQSLLAIFLDSVERAIAAPLLGLASAGLLDISQKLPTMAATVPGAFASAFIPAASYLHGGLEGTPEQQESIRKLYLKGARYMNLTAAYMCGFVAAIPYALFHVWMNKDFPGAAYLMVVFAIATQVHLLTGPGTSILRGIGFPKEEFYYCIPNLLLLFVTVPLAYIVEGRWTTVGIGTAVPIATVLASIIFLWRANMLLGVTARRYWRAVIVPGVIPYFVALLFTVPVTRVVERSDRWSGAAWIILAGIIYTILIAAIVDRFIWEKDERLWFHAVIKSKLLGRLRRQVIISR